MGFRSKSCFFRPETPKPFGAEHGQRTPLSTGTSLEIPRPPLQGTDPQREKQIRGKHIDDVQPYLLGCRRLLFRAWERRELASSSDGLPLKPTGEIENTKQMEGDNLLVLEWDQGSVITSIVITCSHCKHLRGSVMSLTF